MSKQSTPKEVQLVINDVPAELAEKIDAIAKREHRSRAAQLRVMLAEIVAKREQEEGALGNAA